MRNSLIVLEERQHSDPRLELEPQALALASRNSFPVVAQRSGRKEGAGLAVGVAGALLLGGVTFLSLSGHRTRRRLFRRLTLLQFLPGRSPRSLAQCRRPRLPSDCQRLHCRPRQWARLYRRRCPT